MIGLVENLCDFRIDFGCEFHIGVFFWFLLLREVDLESWLIEVEDKFFFEFKCSDVLNYWKLPKFILEIFIWDILRIKYC